MLCAPVRTFGCVSTRHETIAVLSAEWAHLSAVTVPHLGDTFHTWVGQCGVWLRVQLLLWGACVSVHLCMSAKRLTVACAVWVSDSCEDQVLFASVTWRGLGSRWALHLLPQCSQLGRGHSQPYRLHPSQNSLSILLVIRKEREASPSWDERSLQSPLATAALLLLLFESLCSGCHGHWEPRGYTLWSPGGVATPPSHPLTQCRLLRDRKNGGGLHRDPEGLLLNLEVATGSPCLSFPICNQQDTDPHLTSTFPRDAVGLGEAEQPR